MEFVPADGLCPDDGQDGLGLHDLTPGIPVSLAGLTAGMTLDDARRQRADAAAYLTYVEHKNEGGIEFDAARGYLALCDLEIEFLEEQLA